jgi:hypothetical protein
MATTPLTELASSLKLSGPEKKRKDDESLVNRFISELREHGVKIRSDKGRKGNHLRLELGKAGLEVSLHESTDWGWWGVGENYIKKVEKWGDPWGVILFTPKERFWVAGRNFRTITTGDLDHANGYNVHLDKLKESSRAIRFSSVSDFLRISGLSDLL